MIWVIRILGFVIGVNLGSMLDVAMGWDLHGGMLGFTAGVFALAGSMMADLIYRYWKNSGDSK